MFIFECPPLFLLSLFWPPPFSVYLSLSLSGSFLSFFLLVFLFCFLLVPCFSLFLFLSSLIWFHERNNIKIFNCKFIFHQSFLFFLFSVFCFLIEMPFCCLCFPLLYSYVFCSTSMLLVSKTQVEKHQFLVKRGLQQNVF